MPKKIKIESFPDARLAEIYDRNSVMQFAFVSSPKDNNRQCHPFVQCRDFLQDAVRAYLHKNSAAIYNFRYTFGENPPIDMKKTRMLVKAKAGTKTDEVKVSMARAKKLLRHYEKMADFTATRTCEVVNQPNMCLFISDERWISAPHFVSFYTLLIRLGEFEIKFRTDAGLQKEFGRICAEKHDHISDYLKSCRKQLTPLMQNFGKLSRVGSYQKGNIYEFHNHSGIVSLCSGDHLVKDLTEIFQKISKENSITKTGRTRTA